MLGDINSIEKDEAVINKLKSIVLDKILCSKLSNLVKKYDRGNTSDLCYRLLSENHHHSMIMSSIFIPEPLDLSDLEVDIKRRLNVYDMSMGDFEFKDLHQNLMDIDPDEHKIHKETCEKYQRFKKLKSEPSYKGLTTSEWISVYNSKCNPDLIKLGQKKERVRFMRALGKIMIVKYGVKDPHLAHWSLLIELQNGDFWRFDAESLKLDTQPLLVNVLDGVIDIPAGCEEVLVVKYDTRDSDDSFEMKVCSGLFKDLLIRLFLNKRLFQKYNKFTNNCQVFLYDVLIDMGWSVTTPFIQSINSLWGS